MDDPQQQLPPDPWVEQDEAPARREARKAVVLELLAEGCNLREAAAALGIHRGTIRRWRLADPEFAAGVRTAFKANVESLKGEAERRAMNGSDKLLMFLLCNYAPEQFSQQSKVEVSAGAGLAEAIIAARQRARSDCPLA